MSQNTNTYGRDIHLTETDASTIYSTVITSLEEGVGTPLYGGDERRIYGEALVAVLVAVYNTLDDVGRQTMLKYARGDVLDALGERLGVFRLAGSKAKTVMRFSVSAARETNIIIPKGAKVTSDGERYFATDDIAVLQAGETAVDVPASAAAVGASYNGYAASTINTLVDLIPYIQSVTNLTETAGGDDGEPYDKDGDNRLRERIRLAPSKRSTAGSELSYIYWAMTADSSIADVKAVNDTETITRTLPVYGGHAFIGGSTLMPDSLAVKPHGGSIAAVEGTDYTAEYDDDLLNIALCGSLADAESIDITISRTLDGCVKVVTLLENGGIPDKTILDKVTDTVSAKDIRPMCDKVYAVAPEAVSYDIEVVYYTEPADEAEVVNNVEGTGGAIERFVEWQCAALGRDINPDKLRALVLAPKWADDLTGAIRLDVVKPVYTQLTDTQVAQFSGNLKVSHESMAGVI